MFSCGSLGCFCRSRVAIVLSLQPLLLLLPLSLLPSPQHCMLSTSNFRKQEECYHDSSRRCRMDDRPVACEATWSMKNSGVKCTMVTVNQSIEPSLNTDLQSSDSDSGIHISHRFVYPSKSAYCYPYLNLSWEVAPDLLKDTAVFQVRISYDHLGEKRDVVKLVNVYSNGTAEIPVRFFYTCHQVAYPGVIYNVSVQSFDDRRQVATSAAGKTVRSPCYIEFQKNQITSNPGSRLKDNWIPNYRIAYNVGGLTLFFSMPDCRMGYQILGVVVSHGETEAYSKKVDCTCPYDSAVTVDHLSPGSYKLMFFAYTATSVFGSKIVEREFEMPGSERERDVIFPPAVARVAEGTPSESTKIGESLIKPKYGELNSEKLYKEKDKSDLKWKVPLVAGVVLAACSLAAVCVYVGIKFRKRQKVKKCSTRSSLIIRKTFPPDEGNVSSTPASTRKTFDSGICSKCSHSETERSSSCREKPKISPEADGASADRFCTCRENCPECSSFSFDVRMKFHPPSLDAKSMDSFEFREKITFFNSDPDDL